MARLPHTSIKNNPSWRSRGLKRHKVIDFHGYVPFVKGFQLVSETLHVCPGLCGNMADLGGLLLGRDQFEVKYLALTVMLFVNQLGTRPEIF